MRDKKTRQLPGFFMTENQFLKTYSASELLPKLKNNLHVNLIVFQIALIKIYGQTK